MARKEKKYHFIYKTTNVVTNRYYYGMHSTDNLDDNYLGSGRRLKYSINKHGKENHEREIVEFCQDRSSLKKRESELVNLNEIAKKDCMNLMVGGTGGFVSKEAARKGAKALKIKYGDEYKNKLIEWGAKGGQSTSDKHGSPFNNIMNRCNWTNKSHTEKTKRKMSESSKGIGIGNNNSQFGTCWITNEKDNRKINKEDLIPEGWRLGRKII